MLSNETKTFIEQFKHHENDSGSMEMQIAALTFKITQLTGHFKLFPKDFGSKRGLLRMVSRRNNYLCYLERTNKKSYIELIQRLGLRK